MTKTHWKKLHNPDYLGSWALQPGQDIVVTIRSAAEETVTGADGKKEDCMVMRFVENDVKPMIVNSTNAKMIQKVLKTPYIEDWAGRKIQLYVESVKAFGDVVDAIRVRPYLPKVTEPDAKCADCGNRIGAAGTMNPVQMAAYTQKKYGRPLCAECATKAAEESKGASDVL